MIVEVRGLNEKQGGVVGIKRGMSQNWSRGGSSTKTRAGNETRGKRQETARF